MSVWEAWGCLGWGWGSDLILPCLSPSFLYYLSCTQHCAGVKPLGDAAVIPGRFTSYRWVFILSSTHHSQNLYQSFKGKATVC